MHWMDLPRGYYHIVYQPRKNGLAVGPQQDAYVFGIPRSWRENFVGAVTVISVAPITEVEYRMCLIYQRDHQNEQRAEAP